LTGAKLNETHDKLDEIEDLRTKKERSLNYVAFDLIFRYHTRKARFGQQRFEESTRFHFFHGGFSHGVSQQRFREEDDQRFPEVTMDLSP
jgi:hypothetical protein